LLLACALFRARCKLIQDKILTQHQHFPTIIMSRIEIIDFARGIALLAMTLFHFGWDMELFGVVKAGFAGSPAMVWFARCIASSFLFLVGVGLVFAHQTGFNKKAYLLRLTKVIIAAIVITIATYYVTPAFYIFFGILHHIALASILGLLFLKFPYWLNYIFGFSSLFLGIWLKLDILSNPLWSWTGLSAHVAKSSDFVPLFPFFAAVLFGIGSTQLAVSKKWIDALSKFKFENIYGRTIKYIGRHSLIYYIVHQPIMMGLIALVLYIA